jgi:hypothetical protein
VEERTVANLGRGDNVDETSLAAATAAIITARWGGPPRRAQTPEPALVGGPATPPTNGSGYGGAAHGGATYGGAVNGGATYGGTANGGSYGPADPAAGGYGPLDDTPLTYRRDGGPSSYATGDQSNTYGRAEGLPPAPSGPYGGGNQAGGTNGGANGAPYGGGSQAGGTYGGARATATVDRPPPPPLVERDPEPQPDPGPTRDTFRGAASPPPMFTPATFAAMPDVFAPPLPPTFGAGSDGDTPVYAPPEGYEPEPFDAFVPPPPDVYAPPYPYPPGDYPSGDGGGSASIMPAPVRPAPVVPAPVMPAPGMPGGGMPVPSMPAGAIPAQRLPEPSDALAAPGFPATVAADDFAGSVMTGLAFPEPFVPEPYDPSAFSLAGYGSDGATTNGYDGGSFGYTENGNHTNGQPVNGLAGHGSNGNGHQADGFAPVRESVRESLREPVREAQRESAAARSAAPIGAGPRTEERRRRAAPVDPLDIDTEAMLPRRVPSVPDVPDVFLPNDPAADGFELTRIASYLREEKVDETDNRPDGFDVTVVLAAVRGVTGVRDAQLRWNTGYGHTLRVEFDPGADEGEVTRSVAGMLRESMGLAAQSGLLGVPGSPGAMVSPRFNGENTLERNRRATAAVPVAGPAGRATRTEASPNRPMPVPARADGVGAVRVVLDHVQVTTLGAEATIEVRLAVAGGAASGAGAKGTGQGPAVDAYLLRLAASAAGDAVDQLLVDPASRTQRGRVFIEHVSVVPFGSVEVAVVVALLMCGPDAEQVSGSAIVTGDPRHAVVRATLSAVNRRLESLLA